MNVLLDTNVVLDVLLQRHPHAAEAIAIWRAHERGRCAAFISALTPINVFYVVRKTADIATAQRAVWHLITTIGICPIDAAILHAAHRIAITDYEDAVQHESATAAGLDAIVTRDRGDFRGATLPVYSPTDLLARLPT